MERERHQARHGRHLAGACGIACAGRAHEPALKCTVGFAFYCPLSFGKREDGGDRFFSHWTYESLFQERPSPLWPHWPPFRVYPSGLPSCPEKNKSNEGQVISGEAIVLDGIYEPWFFTGGVGCPNYLLKGQTAHQYQPEGSNDLVPVRWRLLWEDRRYIDGTVPAEEAHYVDIAAEISSSEHGVFSGDICPQTGNWRAPRLNNRQEHVEHGQPMPGPASTPTGSVVWYLQND
ncbi:Imm72 family immunity protein [Variovorax boronicumulans]|uniref:Imm72 family immunity protein n=1 Tax=Variovorax boronicumulans TaxID=436515 RepID=UPI0035203D55